MKIGEIEILPVIDGYLTFPVEQDYVQPGTLEYEAHKDTLQPDGRRRMTLGGFLVRLPGSGRTILVDAGSGPSGGELFHPPSCDCPAHAHPAIRAWHDHAGMDDAARQGHLDWLAQTESRYGGLLDSLAGLGVDPGEITDVVLSHMHFDHIGWLSHQGRPTFANATIRVGRQDIAHFTKPEQAIDDGVYAAAWGVRGTAEVLAPVLDRIEPFDGDCTIAQGFDVMATPGHTPGHSIFALSSGTARGMLLGDVVHCPLQLTDLDFSVMADIDPALADRQRERVYREIAGEEIAVAGVHFPGLRFGRVLEGQGRAGWLFVN
jgi:glyoxylase-like metal-dependent hydrolase (beta-lactamase superfamily II)